MNGDNETKQIVVTVKLLIYLLIFLGVVTPVFFSYWLIISCFWLFYIEITNTEISYTLPFMCSVVISVIHCLHLWVTTKENKENKL